MTAETRVRARRSAPARAKRLVLHGAPEPSPETIRLLDRIALAILVAVAGVLLALALGPHRIGDYFTETDFYGAYAEGARLIQRGVLDPSRYGVIGPLYEIVLGVVGFAIPDLFLAAELLSVISIVAGLFLWHRLLARRVGSRVAVAALALLAVNTTVLRYGFSVGTDGLAFALQAASLTVLLTATGPRAALWAGLLAAAAFLTRYTAIYLLPAGLIAALAGGTLQADRRRTAWLFALGFVAPVLPWVLYSLARGGSLQLQLHHNIAYDVFARSRGIAWDEYQRTIQPEFKSLWDVIARDPVGVARRELFNVWDHLRLDAVDLMGLPLAACAGAGVVLGWRDGTLRRLRPILIAGALLYLALVPAFYSPRYSLPLLPVYAALAAVVFASSLFAVPLGRGVWLKPLLLAVPLALALLVTRRDLAYVLNQLPVEVLEAARVLRENARQGDRVIARKPHLAYHAGVSAQAFPFVTTLPELAAASREAGARWIFMSWPEAEMRPAFGYLLDTAAVVPGLAVRYSASQRPAVLYEVGDGFGTIPPWLENDTLRAFHQARGRLRINARDRRMLMTMGSIARARGQSDEARMWLERAAQAAPRDLEVLMALGELYLQRGDGERAAAVYQRAEAIDPGNASARIGRGWASLVQRRPQEAAMWWRPVVAVTRDTATLQRMIELYRALGDAAAENEARAALARAGTRP